jgi:hypothetical protein
MEAPKDASAVGNSTVGFNDEAGGDLNRLDETRETSSKVQRRSSSPPLEEVAAGGQVQPPFSIDRGTGPPQFAMRTAVPTQASSVRPAPAEAPTTGIQHPAVEAATAAARAVSPVDRTRIQHPAVEAALASMRAVSPEDRTLAVRHWTPPPLSARPRREVATQTPSPLSARPPADGQHISAHSPAPTPPAMRSSSYVADHTPQGRRLVGEAGARWKDIEAEYASRAGHLADPSSLIGHYLQSLAQLPAPARIMVPFRYCVSASTGMPQHFFWRIIHARYIMSVLAICWHSRSRAGEELNLNRNNSISTQGRSGNLLGRGALIKPSLYLRTMDDDGWIGFRIPPAVPGNGWANAEVIGNPGDNVVAPCMRMLQVTCSGRQLH